MSAFKVFVLLALVLCVHVLLVEGNQQHRGGHGPPGPRKGGQRAARNGAKNHPQGPEGRRTRKRQGTPEHNGERGPRPDKPERGPRPDKPERGPRPDKPERGPRPDKPEKGPRPDKPERGPRPDKPERGPRPDKPERGPRPDKPERGPRPDKPERGPRPDKPHRGPRPDKPHREHEPPQNERRLNPNKGGARNQHRKPHNEGNNSGGKPRNGQRPQGNAQRKDTRKRNQCMQLLYTSEARNFIEECKEQVPKLEGQVNREYVTKLALCMDQKSGMMDENGSANLVAFEANIKSKTEVDNDELKTALISKASTCKEEADREADPLSRKDLFRKCTMEFCLEKV